MAEFSVGDRVKVNDKPGWVDGGYKIAGWEGRIVEVMKNPAGWVLMKADKTGYAMLFNEKELEKIPPGTQTAEISKHDGVQGFIDALQQKTKGKTGVDVNLDS
jgi:hypothetical protein